MNGDGTGGESIYGARFDDEFDYGASRLKRRFLDTHRFRNESLLKLRGYPALEAHAAVHGQRRAQHELLSVLHHQRAHDLPG